MIQLKKNYIVLFSLAAIFISCQDNNKQAKQKDLPFPKVLDTSFRAKAYLDFFDSRVDFNYAYYYIYYIGPRKKTIYVNDILHWSESRTKDKKAEVKEHFYYSSEQELKLSEESKIQIEFDRNVKLHKHMPVLITNLEDQAINIGNEFHLDIVLEAKDSFQHWQKIQKLPIVGCGTGLKLMKLAPNECILTFSPILKGNFKTKLRFNMGKSISKEFVANIQYDWFHIK